MGLSLASDGVSSFSPLSVRRLAAALRMLMLLDQMVVGQLAVSVERQEALHVLQRRQRRAFNVKRKDTDSS